MVAVHLDDFAHRAPDRERAADDRAGAGAGDQIEAPAEIKAFFAPRAGELNNETIQECGGVDAAHATAVQAQHPVGLDSRRRGRPVRFDLCNHARQSAPQG